MLSFERDSQKREYPLVFGDLSISALQYCGSIGAELGNQPGRVGEIGLCAGSRHRYSFEVVALNTLHANGPSTLSSSDMWRGTGILPKMDADVVGENVECTLAQDPIGPICRLGRHAQ